MALTLSEQFLNASLSSACGASRRISMLGLDHLATGARMRRPPGVFVAGEMDPSFLSFPEVSRADVAGL